MACHSSVVFIYNAPRGQLPRRSRILVVLEYVLCYYATIMLKSNKLMVRNLIYFS